MKSEIDEINQKSMKSEINVINKINYISPKNHIHPLI